MDGPFLLFCPTICHVFSLSVKSFPNNAKIRPLPKKFQEEFFILQSFPLCNLSRFSFLIAGRMFSITNFSVDLLAAR